MKFNSPVAVIGASGFVGSRLVEMFHLGGVAPVRAVVRSVNGLARLSRFDLDWRLADATDPAALTEALKGCELVVHAVVGDVKIIGRAADALLPAAAAAGVKRIVYLSSASVHGLNPAAGTDETTPLSDRQPFAYNNAKVRAERTLLKAWHPGGPELVILRPSIVFGPRDHWVKTLTEELHAGRAWLVEGGRGICNSMYVDNLVQAIECAMTAPAAQVNGNAFLVGDGEEVTWCRFYRQVAEGLGISWESIHQIAVPTFPPPGWRERLDGVRSSGLAQAVLPLFPAALKQAVKGAIQGWSVAPAGGGWELPGKPGFGPAPQMAALQQCAWRFPQSRAVTALGYVPPVSFAEGIRRTLSWQKFAGPAVN